MRASRRLLLLLATWLAVGLGASLVPRAVPLWAGFGAVLLALLFLEARWLWQRPALQLTRTVGGTMALGGRYPVVLRLDSTATRPLRLRLTDHPPACFEQEGLPSSLLLPAGGWAELSYQVRPQRRGEHGFGAADLLLSGPLGLLRRRHRVGDPQRVKVYPDFRAVSGYALLALDNRRSQLGIHLLRRRGQGTEFHQLREYRRGDLLRDVDWKAVSRRRQLISREYREERDQQVIFMLDCGRRMHAQDGTLSHLDHALNALLLLSWVALRQGDAVGVMTFSGQDRWLPPVKGQGGMNAILQLVYDLQSTARPTDYAEAVQRISLRQRRRSLVVLLSNLRDDDVEDLPRTLGPLRRRHLLLLASLRESALREAAEQPVHSFEDALRASAVDHYLLERDRVHHRAVRLGLYAIDSEPAQLPTALVNKYLEIKRAGVL
jgi:uncharacterized protein (DUF58 family)